MEITFDTRENEKQKECCRAWVDDLITDIVYGGAKGGAKSYTGVSLIFGDALMYPGTMYFIARKKLNDLRKHTVPTIKKVFSDWKLSNAYYKFNGQDNMYTLYNGSIVFLINCEFQPSDPEYMRFGSMTMTRGMIEEAGEVDIIAKSNLQASIGRWKNNEYRLVPKLLQTCNPSKNYLYTDYYRPWREGKLEPWKRFIQAFPSDNKMLDHGYVENLERILNKNQKERLLKGNWEYDDDPTVLMDYEKILDIFTNHHVEYGRPKITADIARYGKDTSTVYEWLGFRAKPHQFKKQGTDITAAEIEKIRMRLRCGKSDVMVDEDGIGGGIVDFYKCKGFVNNSSPLPSPQGPKDRNGNPIRENFDNLKSQCYFRLADRVNNGLLYIDCSDTGMQKAIVQELEVVKQKDLDSDLKKGVIPKKDMIAILGRSPDFADGLMIREGFELMPSLTWAAM